MVNLVKVPTGYFTILDFMTMSEFERNVALSEYRRMIQQPLEMAEIVAQRPVQQVKKKTRKVSKYSRALSKELKSVRKAATLKSGKLRKGMTPGKILKKAHRNVKRRLK